MTCDLNFNCQNLESFLILNKMIDPELTIMDTYKKYSYLDGIRLQKVFSYLNQDFIYYFFKNKNLIKISITTKEEWLNEIIGTVFEITDKNINVFILRSIFNELLCEISRRYLKYS